MASSKTTNADLQVEVVKMKTGDPNPVSEWMDFGQEKVVEACVKDLKSAGWILLRGGMKGNPPAQAAPAAPERRVGEGNVFVEKILEKSYPSGGFTQEWWWTNRVDPKHLGVNSGTWQWWQDPAILSYTCWHLDEGEHTHWVLEPMDHTPVEVSEIAIPIEARGRDLFIYINRLPMVSPQPRAPGANFSAICIMYTANKDCHIGSS
ncbi:hypothetical protein MMC28_004611 [Mycoblastus sanguinarius]|nr:hypothetical protein [Mycoblastus sanguinarius]